MMIQKMITKVIQSKKTTNQFILLFFIFLAFIASILGYTGHFGYDDLHYAKLASEWMHGHFDASDHYSYRWTILFFTSLSYLVFGINDFASALPAFIMMVGILFNLYLILKRYNTLILIIGLTLTVFSQWFLFYSSKLMPDIYVAFAVVTSLHAFYRYRFRKASNIFSHALIFISALFFGFLSKGTIVLILPLLLYILITDIIFKRHLKFWVYSVLFGLLLMAIYLLITFLITGNPLARFVALDANAYKSLCSYGDQPINVLLSRISTGLVKLITLEGMLVSSLFVLAFLFQRASFDLFRLDTPFSFFYVSTIVLFISSNFMTISFSQYNPMCLDVRHYLFLIPISAIPASRIIYLFMMKRIQGIHLMIVFLVTIIYTFLHSDTQHALVYNLFLILIIVKFFIPTTFRRPLHFVLAFLFILSLNPFRMIYEASMAKYARQKRIVKQDVIGNFEDAVIVTNDVQRRLSNYYKGFSDEDGPNFVDYSDVNEALNSSKASLLLLNPYTSFLAKQEVPYFGLVLKATTAPILSDDKTGIQLYELKSMPELIELAHSSNSFEKRNQLWENELGATDKVSFSGDKAMSVLEFSPMFRYKLDSSNSENPPSLLIDVSFMALFRNTNKAQIVVVYESEGREYHRESRLFDQYIKSIGDWWNAESHIYVSSNIIKKNTQILFYIWNPKKKEFYIDDVEITISSVEGI